MKFGGAGGTTTRYLVDDLSPTGYTQVVEELVGGSVTRRYTNGFQRISENQVVNNAWTPSFYGYDGLGSVRQLTNLSGAVTDTYDYDAFGNLLSSTGTTPNDFRYRGEQFDSTLGLQYLRARYYNPTTGRFMSRDSNGGNIYDPASQNHYSYSNANPVTYHDPSGHDALIDAALIDGMLSLQTAVYVTPIVRTVNCMLYTDAATLAAISGQISAGGTDLSYINVDFAGCDAQAAGTPLGDGPGGRGYPGGTGYPEGGDPGDLAIRLLVHQAESMLCFRKNSYLTSIRNPLPFGCG